MNSLGLAMIVRDAAGSIGHCIESARPLIDKWTIVDTGSTDGTQDIIRAALADLPGTLHESEWRNFAHNRTELLELARGSADYLLLLDADLTVEQLAPLSDLGTDCGMLRILGSGNLDYQLPLLVRGDKEWEYKGYAHSYLAARDGHASRQLVEELVVHDHGSTGEEKLRRDIGLLTQELADSPGDPRATYYLAQTYADLDLIDAAIATYRARASLGGFDEERFYALYRAGALTVEHRSFSEGADLLLEAWRMRPHRAEPLRALSHSARHVADKIPYPDDVLFVHRDAYLTPREVSTPPVSLEAVSFDGGSGLSPADVSAVIVTRGNVDLAPILETLPFSDVVIWDNSKRPEDLKPYGRYAAISEAKHDVIFTVDDDVIFTAYDALLAAYEPGKLVANMDRPWIEGAGYDGLVAMGGAGSLHDKGLHEGVFARYLAAYEKCGHVKQGGTLDRGDPVGACGCDPDDDFDFLIESDFIFGVLVPFKIIDIGYEARPFSDDPDRLYTQPWQTEKKWGMIGRCRAILESPWCSATTKKGTLCQRRAVERGYCGAHP